VIRSRIGIERAADTYARTTSSTDRARLAQGPCACVFVDEAQFLSPRPGLAARPRGGRPPVPVMAYGLRVDFRGELFPGSATLLALADEMREVRTICHCGARPPWSSAATLGQVLTEAPRSRSAATSATKASAPHTTAWRVGDSPSTSRLPFFAFEYPRDFRAAPGPECGGTLASERWPRTNVSAAEVSQPPSAIRLDRVRNAFAIRKSHEVIVRHRHPIASRTESVAVPRCGSSTTFSSALSRSAPRLRAL
jgi:hypothetical protein